MANPFAGKKAEASWVARFITMRQKVLWGFVPRKKKKDKKDKKKKKEKKQQKSEEAKEL